MDIWEYMGKVVVNLCLIKGSKSHDFLLLNFRSEMYNFKNKNLFELFIVFVNSEDIMKILFSPFTFRDCPLHYKV